MHVVHLDPSKYECGKKEARYGSLLSHPACNDVENDILMWGVKLMGYVLAESSSCNDGGKANVSDRDPAHRA